MPRCFLSMCDVSRVPVTKANTRDCPYPHQLAWQIVEAGFQNQEHLRKYLPQNNCTNSSCVTPSPEDDDPLLGSRRSKGTRFHSEQLDFVFIAWLPCRSVRSGLHRLIISFTARFGHYFRCSASCEECINRMLAHTCVR